MTCGIKKALFSDSAFLRLVKRLGVALEHEFTPDVHNHRPGHGQQLFFTTRSRGANKPFVHRCLA